MTTCTSKLTTYNFSSLYHALAIDACLMSFQYVIQSLFFHVGHHIAKPGQYTPPIGLLVEVAHVGQAEHVQSLGAFLRMTLVSKQ